MATLYPMAPGSGCQLNRGRVSGVASPKGPNRENPVLATGAGGAASAGNVAGATGRADAASVCDVAGAADGAGVAGAGDAGGTASATGSAGTAAARATSAVVDVLRAGKLPCLHQTVVATPATRIAVTEAIRGSGR